MIAISRPNPEPTACTESVVYAEWNPHADPPRWEFAGPCVCDCCDVDPDSIEVIIVHAPSE